MYIICIYNIYIIYIYITHTHTHTHTHTPHTHHTHTHAPEVKGVVGSDKDLDAPARQHLIRGRQELKEEGVISGGRERSAEEPFDGQRLGGELGAPEDVS
jgi:IS5 family transposase